ncbi:MAG TPA: caspase family protein [Phytomonospora sp.]
MTDLPRVAEAAESATDTLLVYFAGHGFVESDGDLYLGLKATELPRRKHSALPYDRLRDLVRDSPARNRVVVLDCCYAGRAVGMLAEDGDPSGQLDITGTYILAATSPTRRAHAPDGERHSAFTGALLSLLHQGIDNGEPLIRIAHLFPHLRSALVARGLPSPQQRGTDTVGDLALAPNPRV